ncbi:MAG TPA: hypothetical protein VJM33_18460 [Microthrixaceae bacterium]|nr:hypothetical protein [Microthrixaceae bacterium]
MAHELVRHHLRHAICLMLHQHRRAMKVSDIVALLELAGHQLRGRPTQAVSDALRTEVRAGRVVKLDHGTYAPGVATPAHLRYATRSLQDRHRQR